MNRRAATIAMCMLMVVSTAPLTNAEGQEESSIWGITYDWSHFEGDAFNMTGVDVNELNADLSAAAEYAGFDMDYDEVLSGTTQVFVESWDESGPFTVTTEDGTSHQVGKRITELTVRHGSMADTGMATNWSDGGEKIEAWLSAYQDYLLVMNANYVEYVDENMFVYGAEIALDSTFSVSMGFDAEIGVTAASETVSPDVSANMQLSFDIPNLEATWSPYEAVDYHFVMGSQPSSESGPGVDPDDDWHPYTYCSSEEFQTYQMCNEVEFEQGDRRFIAYHEPGGGELQGSFSSISSYSMEVSAEGIPTEELDVDIDVFNVALSDSIPDQGLIYGEMEVDSYALWGHNCPPISNSETVTIDGTDYQAQCGLVLPVPWAMAGMMGQSLSQALESGVQELADVAMGEVEEVLGEVVDSGGGDDHFEPDFVCDDGETIPRYWFNDGYPDCSDGSDELASNDGHHDGDGPYYEWVYEQPTEFPSVTEGSSLDHVLYEGEMTYCTDPYYPPFQSYDSGTLVGFDVDVADHLASTLSEEYGTPVQFIHVESAWDPIIPNLNEGTMCDAIISAMTKTPERESVVDFTRGYYTSSQGVVGAPGSANVSDVYELDVDGVKIGVGQGTFADFWTNENFGHASIFSYGSTETLLQAVDNGDVTYALSDTYLLSNSSDSRTIMATFGEEHFGIALREGNNELLTALDVAITNLLETEDYSQMHTEWLQGEPYVINDWSPDWDFGSQEYYGDESGDSSEDGFRCTVENWQVIPSSGVNDGYPDCYDGSDEQQSMIWACYVDVRVDSLPDTSIDSFATKINNHPGFPEWCGEEVGELQIGETQPNLPPEDDIYGSVLSDPDWTRVLARNATHFHEFEHSPTHGWSDMQDCVDSFGATWVEEYSTCAFTAPQDIAIDGELIQSENGWWTRYQWSGDDYLYLASPASASIGGGVWNGAGPRATDFMCDPDDPYDRVSEWQVGDGVEDCYNGEDENPDASSDEPGDPAGSTDLESMFEALDASNLQKTMEAFSERLDILLQDNVPDEPKYDLEDLCATMLWDPSDVRVLGVALVLEGGLLLGPQIENSMPHPTTTINVQFLSGQAARDAKSGASIQSSFDEMAPPSKHDLAKLYEILGPDYLPDLDTTDSDGDGTMDFFDSDDDNDGIPDWEDSEPKSLESEAGSSSLPAHGLVATLSVIAAAAMLIPRRED